MFFDGFWGSGPALPPPISTLGASPGMCLAALAHKTELTPSVFQHFRISGFPVPMRERLPKGNLPLSEDVSEDYSGETAGGGTPHASRAGGTVADISKYVEIHDQPCTPKPTPDFSTGHHWIP